MVIRGTGNVFECHIDYGNKCFLCFSKCQTELETSYSFVCHSLKYILAASFGINIIGESNYWHSIVVIYVFLRISFKGTKGPETQHSPAADAVDYHGTFPGVSSSRREFWTASRY